MEIERSDEFKLNKMECRIQDLTQENDEEKLLNLQYQTTNRTLISLNKDLKKENQYLRDENRNLTDKINRIESEERGLKRRLNHDSNEENIISNSSAKHSDRSPDTSTLNDKLPDRKNLDEKIRQLMQNNSKLLEEKEHYKIKFDNCYQSFVANKKSYDSLKKDYEQIRNEKVSELKKDPRITSMIHREKDDKIDELKKKNFDLVKRLEESQEQFFVDLKCIKKERDVEEAIQEKKTQLPLRSLESDSKKIEELQKKIAELKATNDLLDDGLKKKSAELVKFVGDLKVIKSKLDNQRQTTEVDKALITSLENELKNEKGKNEKEKQDVHKLIEQKVEINSIKLKQQYECQLNKLKTDYETEISDLKAEFAKKCDGEVKSEDVLITKVKELSDELKIKIDEIEKFKMLYSKVQEELHKKISLINSLNKDKEDMKRQYDLICENCILIREKVTSTEKELDAKNLEIKALETQVNQLKSQFLSNLRSSPRGYLTSTQNLSCSSPTISQQNQMLDNSQNNFPNNSQNHLLNNSNVSQLLNSNRLLNVPNLLNNASSIIGNNMNNMSNLIIASNVNPDIAPPSYNFVRQNQNNLVNLLIQQQLASNDNLQQNHFLQERLVFSNDNQFASQNGLITIPTNNNQTDSPSSPDNLSTNTLENK